MREHPAGFICCCEYILHDLDTDDTKRDMLHHGHGIISMLQYFNEYKYDVDLIQTTHKINKGGASEKEATSFDALYKKFNVELPEI